MFTQQLRRHLSRTICINKSQFKYCSIPIMKKDQQIEQIERLNQLFDSLGNIDDIRHSASLVNQIKKIKNKQFIDFNLNEQQKQVIRSSLSEFIQYCRTNVYNINDLAQLVLFLEDLKQSQLIRDNVHELQQIFIHQLAKLDRLSEQDQVDVINILEILNFIDKGANQSSFLKEFYDLFNMRMQEQEIQGSVLARVLFIYKLEDEKYKYDLKELENELLVKVDELRAQNFQHFIRLYYLIPAVNYQNLELFNLIEQELIEIMDKFNTEGFQKLMNWMKYSKNLSTQFCMKFEKIILNRLHRFKSLEQLNQILNFIQLNCFDYNSDGIYKITQIIIESNIHNLQDLSNNSHDLEYKLAQNEENKKIFMNLNKAKYLEIQNESLKNEGRIPEQKQIVLDSSVYSEHKIHFKDTFEYLNHEINNTKRLEQINKYLQLLLQFGMNNNQIKQILHSLYRMFMVLVSNRNNKQEFKTLVSIIHNLINLKLFFNFDELLIFNKNIVENIEKQMCLIISRQMDSTQFPQLFLRIYEFGMIQQIQGMQDDNLQIIIKTLRKYVMNMKHNLSIVQTVKLLHIITLSPSQFDRELFEKVNAMLDINRNALKSYENQNYLKKEYFQAIEKYKLMVQQKELELNKLQNKFYKEGKLEFEEQSSKFNNKIFNIQSILIKFIQEYLDERELSNRYAIHSNQVLEVFHFDIVLTDLETGKKVAIKIQKNKDSYINIKEDKQNIADHQFIGCLQWMHHLGIQCLSVHNGNQQLLWRIHHKNVADYFRKQLDMIV